MGKVEEALYVGRVTAQILFPRPRVDLSVLFELRDPACFLASDWGEMGNGAEDPLRRDSWPGRPSPGLGDSGEVEAHAVCTLRLVSLDHVLYDKVHKSLQLLSRLTRSVEVTLCMSTVSFYLESVSLSPSSYSIQPGHPTSDSSNLDTTGTLKTVRLPRQIPPLLSRDKPS